MKESISISEEEILCEVEGIRSRINQELRKVFIGQEKVVEEVLITLLSRGHALITGVPGLGKTLLIKSLSQLLNLSFNRIQFTPDLMPSDITGTDIIEEDTASGKRTYKFLPGPIFANIVLADEINRTPPKTQAALLESMQEYRVTVGGKTYSLDLPFFVLATQNPIEMEGTYPLPEAQLDRFMFNIRIDYPSLEEERTIVKLTTYQQVPSLSPVIEKETIIRLQNLTREVPVSDFVMNYALKLVRATRPGSPDAPDFVNEWVTWGASPRAIQYLILGAKAR
ncbi:MAG: AAA domain-containing protein, partial [Caldiserica bacterium]|nr:AAA domain-containing protein [Caldisericota bacterium]